MTKFRYALAAAAIAGAVAPLTAQPAQAMMCLDEIQPVCSTLGVVCSLLDNPKFGILQCPGLG